MRVVVMAVGVVGMVPREGVVRREVGRVVEVVGRVRVNEAVLLGEVVWAAERAAAVKAAEMLGREEAEAVEMAAVVRAVATMEEAARAAVARAAMAAAATASSKALMVVVMVVRAVALATLG